MVLEKKFNATLSNYGMEKLEIVQRYQIILFDDNVSYVIRLWYGKIRWATLSDYGMEKKVGCVIKLCNGKIRWVRFFVADRKRSSTH